MTSSPSNDVMVAGVGLTPVGEHWSISLRELALEAIEAARADAGGLRPQALFAANMLAPALSGQTHLGALLADFAGLRGIEASSFEAAGASGGAALRQGFLAVSSGLIDVALIIGVEKATDRIGSSVDAAMAMSADADYEAVQGLTPAAQAGLLMRRYLHEAGAPADALGGFCVTAHANGVNSPHAFLRRAISMEEYRSAPRESDPLNIYDIAPLADGAAALVLARREAVVASAGRPWVRIAASSVATAALALHDQTDVLGLDAARLSAQRAYELAGVGPEQIDVFELHDAFSIYAALALEASGFASQGEGWRLAADNEIGLTGRIPAMTFGGSKARGEAGGATGLYQAAEVVLQVQGRAGANQVKDAQIGMAQCIGGAGATAATHIFAAIEP
ncbi:MAG: thiolase domain-containing protein [Chloroflexi bacterium]|nr:thiolase domain-containing protein [Chloroflexota bacterium]